MSQQHGQTQRYALEIGLLIGLSLFAYRSTFPWFYERFVAADTYYSHGFLVPVVSGYLAWRLRHKLALLPSSQSRWGLALVILALTTHLLSLWAHVYFTSGISIILFIYGSCLYLLGKEKTKILLFPILFLVFMLPMPHMTITAISVPLKSIVAKTGCCIVDQLGVPVAREGFNIYLANSSLTIDNPCSGLRSLIAFLALAALMAHLLPASRLRKFTLLMMAIPVALFSNIVRVMLLILVANTYDASAASPGSPWHDYSGLAMFALGLVVLILTSNWLQVPHEK